MKKSRTNYHRHRFPPAIISHAVSLFYRFTLSLREWLPLIEKYADRIVVGGDQFFSPSGNKGPAAKFSKATKPIRQNFEKLLSSLPPALAHKIGYENAARIYRLN